jgi:hypothetical protein
MMIKMETIGKPGLGIQLVLSVVDYPEKQSSAIATNAHYWILTSRNRDSGFAIQTSPVQYGGISLDPQGISFLSSAKSTH